MKKMFFLQLVFIFYGEASKLFAKCLSAFVKTKFNVDIIIYYVSEN